MASTQNKVVATEPVLTNSSPTVVVVSNADPADLVARIQGGSDAQASTPNEPEIIHATDLEEKEWSKIVFALPPLGILFIPN
jgi:hypothetical protein